MRQFGFLLGGSDCLELAKSLATVHMQALTHDKGGKSMIKTFKASLDQ